MVDAPIATMASVVEYPDDPLRTFATSDPHVRRAPFRLPGARGSLPHPPSRAPRPRGPTTIGNLAPLCSFHHLTVIHRWGWMLALHADGSTTATSPDRARTLHDHDPPRAAA